MAPPNRDRRDRLSALNLHYVPENKPIYACVHCSEVVALQDELVSKKFTGAQGRAYLFNSAFNIDLGKKADRELTTGKHACADVFCASCHAPLGWMYIRCPNGEQRYKEGRYILEACHVVKENNW